MGGDIAGEVEAVGAKVKSFRIGDKVFGRSYRGALAEFACLEEKQAAKISNGVAPEIAASLPLAGATALNSLRHKGDLKKGQKVLINGASGGIGTLAIQLARYYGAEVTGVCSSQNHSLVKSLGANYVIDYTKEDFTNSTDHYDLVIDLVGNRTTSEINRILTPKGKCVFVGYSNFRNMVSYLTKGSWLSKTTQKQFIVTDTKIKSEDLNLILELINQKEIKSVISKTFTFTDTPKAFELLGTRHTKGKIVIKL